MKENLHLKLQLNYINNHEKQKIERIKLVIVSIAVDVAKIDDKVQNYQNLLLPFICFLLCQRRSSC